MLLKVALGELDKWDLASWLGFAGDSEEGELIETAGTHPPAPILPGWHPSSLPPILLAPILPASLSRRPGSDGGTHPISLHRPRNGTLGLALSR